MVLSLSSPTYWSPNLSRLTQSFSLFSLLPSFQINLPIEISAGQWRIASLNGPPTDGQCASPLCLPSTACYQTIHRLTKSLLPCLGARFESRGWRHNYPLDRFSLWQCFSTFTYYPIWNRIISKWKFKFSVEIYKNIR